MKKIYYSSPQTRIIRYAVLGQMLAGSPVGSDFENDITMGRTTDDGEWDW